MDNFTEFENLHDLIQLYAERNNVTLLVRVDYAIIKTIMANR